jgi:putative transcriptional regulator
MPKGKITNHIRQYRFNADEMTQEQLADNVGVSRQTIVALEKNMYSPSLDLSFRIARVFNVGIEDIFQFEAAKKP